jgi:tetratricopeptide (TPR) repeat protein
MKRARWIELVLTGSLAAAMTAHSQAPAANGSSAPAQTKPAEPHTQSNPFPEDTNNVPVMPSGGASALPNETFSGANDAATPLAGDDVDPIRSPDDPAPEASTSDATESSSLSGTDRLLLPPDSGEPDKKDSKRKLSVKEPTPHPEGAAEDINVGGYYLDKKNWKAALSRFESAMVLDPENPEVYWGLAEADRHLGDLTKARAYYQQVVDYDPDSKHGKEARKALKEPEIANAKAASPTEPATDKPVQ